MARRIAVGLVLSLILAACASRQALFAVLPNPDGSAGAVTVDDGQKTLVLDKPYAAGEVVKGAAQPVPIDESQVQQIFGSALAAQPIPPAHFVLYFKSDTDILTPESEQNYKRVFEDIKRRPVYEVEVIGHTDTTAERQYNQTLSLSRASMIRERLIKDGLDPKSISVAGRGQLDLAVKTADRVSEPLNRRVEITIR